MNCDQKLLQAFELTSTGQHIEQVESYFQEIEKDRFLLEKLFVIVNDQKSSLRAKIGAAGLLQKKLKNTLNQKTEIPMDYYDLSLIKQGIIHSVANLQDPKVQKNLEEILTNLINTFYPQNWPDLLQEVLQILKDSNNLDQIYGNTRVIYCVFQSYRQSDVTNLKKFNNVLEQLFPYLENVAAQGLKQIEDKFLPVLLTIIKIFLNVSQSEIPFYMDDKKLKLWCYILKQSQQLKIGIQQFNKPQDYNEMYKLEKTELFQVRINSVQALSRLCMIFSNTKKYLNTLLQHFIQVLPSILDQGLSYLDSTLKQNNMIYSLTEISEVYRMLFYSIQIHFNQQQKEIFSTNLFNTIIYELLVNHMSIHQYAQDLFAQDINQYIYSCKNMAHEPTMMLRQQVGNVLTIILKNDENFIKSYLEFSFSVIANNYNPFTKQQASLQLQESVLFGIESCIYHIQIILNHKMDSLIEKLILPALNSNNPFLQAQACCVIKELKECEILDMNLVIQMSQKICFFVQSENLYLRIKSINALQLISTIEETHPYFKNDLQVILKTIFETMQLICIEDLSDCLKTLVEEFQSFISPFAMQITENVLRQFWDVVENKDVNDMDDDMEQVDFIDSLESCLNTIGNILWCDLDQNFYESSINWLTDIMAYILTQKQVFNSLQDSALEVFSVFIYQIKNLNDSILMFYPFLCYSMFGQPQNLQPTTNLNFMTSSQKKLFNNRVICPIKNINCIEKYVGIFGNFIQKAFDIIMTKNDFYGKRLLEYLFDFIDALIQKGMQQNSDLELLYAIKLLSFLFENNYENLLNNYEHFMFEICKYFQNLLKQNRGPTLQSAIHQKYCQMLFLNPKSSLNVWRKLNLYDTVLYGIFGSLNLLIDVDDKSNLLLGIIGLLKLEPQDFPSIIPLSSLMRELLQVVIFLSEEHQKRALFEEENESCQDSDIDRTFNEEEIFEQSDFNYLSPFDDINEISELKKVLNEIEQKNISYFQKLLNELSSNEQGDLKQRMLYFENVNKQIQIFRFYQSKLKQIFSPIKINYKLQMAKPSSDCVQSYHVGLNKGFSVTKLKRPQRPSSRKGKTSNRVREIRKIVQSVAEFSPFEKRVIEMYKTGVAQVEKRAFKLLRKRLGKRSRAIKKRDNINQFIRAQAAKNKSANN